MSLTEFLKDVVHVLDAAGVPYMLTGSLAASYYAVPRATRDIDVVVESSERGIERVVEGLLAAGYYVDRDAALQAFRERGQFNAIDPSRGWKADLIVRRDRSFSIEEFGRRRRASILGVELALASFEDVILAKLEWAKLGDSELQRRDVAQLLERGWNRLDHEYLGRWVAVLDLDAEWKQVLERGGKTKK